MKKDIKIKTEIDADDVPTPAGDFIAFFQDKLDALSEEQKLTAEIETEAEEGWGCPSSTFILAYTRQETDREEWQREDIARSRKYAAVKKEKEQLALLQKKYEVGGQ